nr:MAG TPA: hypothetical protein [Caudoviricetes sp.]
MLTVMVQKSKFTLLQQVTEIHGERWLCLVYK